MAALANVMSVPPLAIPIPIAGFTSSVHFFQLAVFLSGIMAGPWAGVISGAAGSLYMGITKIPFVIGGIAILGGSAALFAKKARPIFACLLAWLVQAPYVLLTDYAWFTLFAGISPTVAWGLVIPVMINLALQAIVCAALTDVIMHYVKRAGISF